jgi:polysaccharide deacetylase 2 family uncharacterized protein YibQ
LVGRFLLGMVSGGLLATGGLVIGSMLFPASPANDNAPASAAIEEPIAVPEATAPEAGEKLEITEAEAAAPDAGVAEAVEEAAAAEAAPEPAATEEVVEPAEVVTDTKPADAPAEAPVVAAAETAPEVPAGDASTAADPVAPVAAEVETPETGTEPSKPLDSQADAAATAPEPAAPAPAAAPEVAAPESEPVETESAVAAADPAPAATPLPDEPAAEVAEAAPDVAADPAPAATPMPDEPAPEVAAEVAEAAPDVAAEPATPALEPAAPPPTTTPAESAPVEIASNDTAPAAAPVSETPASEAEETPAVETAPAVTEPAAETPAAQAPAAEPLPEVAPAVVEPPVVEPPVAEAPATETPAIEPPAEMAEEAPADLMPAETAEEAVPDPTAPEMPGTKPAALPGVPETPAEPPAEEPALAEDDSPTFKPTPGLVRAGEGVIIGRGTEEATEPAPDDGSAPVDPRPIAQFATPFENPDNKPAFAIVLMDDGSPDLDRAGLAALPFPVSFALDPLDPATPDHAAIYRAAGREVIMIATGIAEGAQATDVEVAFQSMEQNLPEAVAVMDLADPTFQNSRALASAVVPILKAEGRGLLTWDEGLNAADQVARREDLEAAVVFRDLGQAGGDAVAVRRLLDRAVFKAGQDGLVSVVGKADPATVTALLEWTVEGKAATVALAPVTAVLKVD